MALTDTAEYWHDVKRNDYKRVFAHIKGKDCGHSAFIDVLQGKRN